MRLGFPDSMTSKRDHPADTLTDPATGRRVWMREFWDGGEAVEITGEGHATCPGCDGNGSNPTPIPDRRRSEWSRRTLPPECDDEEVTCSTCGGSGQIDDALYGPGDDEKARLLWPRSLTDYTDGHD